MPYERNTTLRQMSRCIFYAVFATLFEFILYFFMNLLYQHFYGNLQSFRFSFKAILHPLISIIIPCYNRAFYIPFVFHSLLFDQKIIENRTNFEIIFIDDGSQDNTTQKINFYENYYGCFYDIPKITIIQLFKKSGTLNSRLVGYKTAIGKYILSLDPDDEFIPNFINRIICILNNNPDIEMLHFRIMSVNSKNRNITSFYKNQLGYIYPLMTYRIYTPDQYSQLFVKEPIDTFKYKIVKYYDNKEPKFVKITGDELKSSKIERNFMWNMCSYCFSKDLLIKSLTLFNNKLYNQSICLYEDYYMTYLLLYFCNIVHFIDEIGYIYYTDSPRVTKFHRVKRTMFIQLNRLYGKSFYPQNDLKQFSNDNVLTFE